MEPEKSKQCRFCLSTVNPRHATSLFSRNSSEAKLCSVLGAVFNVPVATDKLLSPYACRKCVESAKAIYSKLQSLQLMARTSYQSILSSPVVSDVSLAASLKRTKDTSGGPGISPSTLKSQPPRKRRPGIGKTLFSSAGTMQK